jgi:hypothetical protein
MVCYFHLGQEGIAMGMQPAQFVTVECKHQWQPKNSSQICHSKWICHWIIPTRDTVFQERW